MIQGSNVHLVGALIGALALFTLALAVFLPYVGRQQGARTTDDDQKKLSSLAGRLPVCEIRDNLIVRRDGSFCAGWECAGVATQFASADRLEAVSSAMDAFIKGIRYSRAEFQFRYLIDHDTSEVLQQRQACVTSPNSPATWLEENRLSFWNAAIDAGQVRSMRLLALLSWKPNPTWETRSALSRFSASLWQGLSREGTTLSGAIRRAFQEAKTKAVTQRNRAEHNQLVAEFDQILETYRLGLEAITPLRRLNEPELVRELYQSLNPGQRQTTRRNCKIASLLNTDWAEGVRFLDLGGALKAVVTLSELPEATFASLPRPTFRAKLL